MSQATILPRQGRHSKEELLQIQTKLRNGMLDPIIFRGLLDRYEKIGLLAATSAHDCDATMIALPTNA